MGKLQDKAAIVTGASNGIGAGIARQLSADGAKVIVNYALSKRGADKAVADIEAAEGAAVVVRCSAQFERAVVVCLLAV